MRRQEEFERTFDRSNTSIDSESDQIKMDSMAFLKIHNESSQISASKEMPQYMIEVITDREKMFHMPLFEMTEKRSFHPQLEY